MFLIKFYRVFVFLILIFDISSIVSSNRGNGPASISEHKLYCLCSCYFL